MKAREEKKKTEQNLNNARREQDTNTIRDNKTEWIKSHKNKATSHRTCIFIRFVDLFLLDSI